MKKLSHKVPAWNHVKLILRFSWVARLGCILIQAKSDWQKPWCHVTKHSQKLWFTIVNYKLPWSTMEHHGQPQTTMVLYLTGFDYVLLNGTMVFDHGSSWSTVVNFIRNWAPLTSCIAASSHKHWLHLYCLQTLISACLTLDICMLHAILRFSMLEMTSIT